MLPGLGFSEIVLLAVIALLVVGPKDLPLLLRRVGQFSARMRGLAAEFRAGFDELARTAELDQLKKEVDSLRNVQALRDLGRSVNELTALPNLLGPDGHTASAPDSAPVSAPDSAPVSAPVSAPPGDHHASPPLIEAQLEPADGHALAMEPPPAVPQPVLSAPGGP